MNYQTYNPTPELAAFIKCYWTLDFPKEDKPERQRIVPDGCMEMIFHCADLYQQYFGDGSVITQPRCFVFGQITRPLEIIPSGNSNIFAIRFNPDGFIAFATMPVSEMENRAVPLQDLFGEDAIQLEKEILNAASAEARIKKIETFLLARLITPEAIDRVVQSGVEAILQLNGQLSVNELSGHVQINRRQLERKFSAAIGLSPKQLSKIARLQSTLKMLGQKKFTNLTELAYENNYYDQAHFIKEFKEFTGMSPGKFYAGNLKLAFLFVDDK